MSNTLLIAHREFKTRMFTKASVISLIVFVAIFVGGGAVVGYFKPFESLALTRVALTDQTAPMALAFAQSTDGAPGDARQEKAPEGTREKGREPSEGKAAKNSQSIEQLGAQAGGEMFQDRYETDVMSEAEARQAVKDETVEFAVVGTLREPVIVSKDQPSLRTRLMISQIAASSVLADEVQKLGGDMDQLQRVLHNVQVRTELVGKDASVAMEQDFGAFIAGSIVIFLLFGMIVGCGQQVAMGVVEEKSSRVVEVLLASVRPGQLLAGKIVGITIVGVVQMVLIGAAAAAGMQLSGMADVSQVSMSGLSVSAFLWLLLGLLTYMTLYAGIAALASRTEDLSAVITPLMLLQIIPLYAAYFMLMNNPNSVSLWVLSWIPFCSCYAMPLRQAFNGVSLWEQAAAMGINLLLIPLLIWLGAFIYRRAILSIGAKVKLSQVFKRA